MKDLYYILGTNAKSTPVEIGEAYRALAKKLGPQAIDNDPFLHSHFREINYAYEILSDPTKRTIYDQAYRKSQRKQLAGFKLSNLNLAASGAFLLFTGLFGYYVVRLVTAVKQPVTVSRPIAQAPVKKPKHHRHKHRAKFTRVAVAKTAFVKKDSIAGAAIKPAPLIKTTPAAKPLPVAPAPPLVIARAPATVVDLSYTTNLKADLAGLVYLHQADDYMSPVVSVLPHRSRIKVLERGSNFYKVNYNQQVGYIPKWTIAKQ